MERKDIWKTKEVLKDLSWSERIDYIWSYFGAYIVIGAVCLVVLISVLTTVLKPKKEVLFGGISFNVSLTEQGQRQLTDELFALMGGTDADKQEIQFQERHLGSKEDYEGYSAQIMSMVALVATQSVDYAILDGEALEQFAPGGMFTDLNQLLTGEQLAQFEGKLVSYELEEQGTVPVAIDISALPFVRECAPGEEKVYIVFPGNTERTEKLDEFFDWLLDWEKD